MKWTREETIIALYVYCLIPFNKANNKNYEIISKAKIMGRTVNSVKMKVGNFGSLDPELSKKGIVGLANISNLDKEIWTEYQNKWDKLALDAEELIAKYKNMSLEDSTIKSLKDKNQQDDSHSCGNDDFEYILKSLPKGIEKERLIRSRINQNFFRDMILSSYENSCCITGINIPSLLEACHIIGWSLDESERMNPCNGLCLSATFHKAFDNFLVTITPDYKFKISDKMYSIQQKDTQSSMTLDYLRNLDNKNIILPNRFLPNKDFLAKHYEQFKKNSFE